MNEQSMPQDWRILRPWFDVIRRLVSVARSEGYSVVTIRVMVDANGKPLFWKEPVRVKIEPRFNTERLEQFFEHFVE